MAREPVLALAVAAVAPPVDGKKPEKKRKKDNYPPEQIEVVALSPKTLMTTNRFICEICKKGFQRDQNLQLHLRGHNLPWKLRQRAKDPHHRVYVCPEKTCIHHHASRALGDLTGIKKHYCRKHGEKRWKCERCGKMYAVYSDWKAHSKTCGTREYRCDCGAIFNRRDSYVTHRAFCDALMNETKRLNAKTGRGNERRTSGNQVEQNTPPPQPEYQPPEETLPNVDNSLSMWFEGSTLSASAVDYQALGMPELATLLNYGEGSAPIASATELSLSNSSLYALSDEKNMNSMENFEGFASYYSGNQTGHQVYTPPEPNSMATALLQKAATMGAVMSNGAPTFYEGLLVSTPNGLLQPVLAGSCSTQPPPGFPGMFVGGMYPTGDMYGGGAAMTTRAGKEAMFMMPPPPPPPQPQPEYMTRDFFGLGGEGTEQNVLEEELERIASMVNSSFISGDGN